MVSYQMIFKLVGFEGFEALPLQAYFNEVLENIVGY